VQWPENWKLDAAKGAADFAHEGLSISLQTDPAAPANLQYFNLTLPVSRGRHTYCQFSDFSTSATLPAWHMQLDRTLLEKHVPVVAVADRDTLSPQAQERLQKLLGMIQGRGVFILRPALRDEKLRAAFEEYSPIQLDFKQLAENEKRLKSPWLAALQEQKFELPKFQPATQPATQTSATAPRPTPDSLPAPP
jgi:hypothetical protein